MTLKDNPPRLGDVFNRARETMDESSGPGDHRSLRWLKKRLDVSEPRKKPAARYRPSSLAHGGSGSCARKLFYDRTIEPDKFPLSSAGSASREAIFAVGTGCHIAFQDMLLRLGFLKRFNSRAPSRGEPRPHPAELPLYMPNLGRCGTADGFIIPYHALLEIKTINWRGYKNLEGPSPVHVRQAQIYMLGTRSPEVRKLIDRPVDRTIFWYVDKATMFGKVHPIEGLPIKDFEIEYDEAAARKCLAPAIEAEDAICSKTLLERPHEDATQMPCSDCAWVGLCHSPEGNDSFQTLQKAGMLDMKAVRRIQDARRRRDAKNTGGGAEREFFFRK